MPTTHPNADQLPLALRAVAHFERLAADTTPFDDGGPPALLTHPQQDWDAPGSTPDPAPIVLWLHGRTVNKELDPGRYLRWKKLGLAACAIDLPGHGERAADPGYLSGARTIQMVQQAVDELPLILRDLAHPRFNNAFDLSRVAIGGMSAGGMVTLAALTRPQPIHRFRACIIEASAGDFTRMTGISRHDPALVDALNPIAHIDHWPDDTPLLAVHSRLDEWVPVEAMQAFIDALRAHHESAGRTPDLARLHLWDETGAPGEHIGFGRKTNDTKNLENEFLRAYLSA